MSKKQQQEEEEEEEEEGGLYMLLPSNTVDHMCRDSRSWQSTSVGVC